MHANTYCNVQGKGLALASTTEFYFTEHTCAHFTQTRCRKVLINVFIVILNIA